MSNEFVITPTNNQQPFTDVAFIGGAQTYSFDFSPWCEENHNLTSATWSVVTGQAAISGQTLVSNVATALLTFAQEGSNLIKITGTTSAEVYVAYLDVLCKDLTLPVSTDYGYCP